MTEKNAKHADASTRLPLHLCPPILQVRVAAVMKAALSKPGRTPYNFQGEASLTAYTDAADRHLTRLKDGEWLDPDSGEPHAACVAANMSIILHADLMGTLERDLPGITGKISALISEYQNKYKSELAEKDVVRFEDGKDCGDPDCKAAECIQTRVERMSEKDKLFESLQETEAEKYKKLWESANAALLSKIRMYETPAMGTSGQILTTKGWQTPEYPLPKCYCDESGISPTTPCKGCPRWGGKETNNPLSSSEEFFVSPDISKCKTKGCPNKRYLGDELCYDCIPF